MANVLQRFSQTISREYERRIRRASQVMSYGTPPHEHADAPEAGDMAEIANIPRGSALLLPTPHDNHHGDSADS